MADDGQGHHDRDARRDDAEHEHRARAIIRSTVAAMTPPGALVREPIVHHGS